ncbi:MAG: response regulator [Clostridiales bacterium]|nr:response regulator [Clostridiales bacterium]
MSVNSKEKINKKTVLIVDDNSINRDVLHKLLKDEFETVEAENGKEALQLLNEHSRKFSAILLDLIMSVMDVEHKL